MLPPVICFTCGFPIGEFDDVFRHMRAELVRKTLAGRGTLAPQAAVDAGLRVDCGPILDQLGIVHDCCRKCLVTAMSYTDYY